MKKINQEMELPKLGLSYEVAAAPFNVDNSNSNYHSIKSQRLRFTSSPQPCEVRVLTKVLKRFDEFLSHTHTT